MKYHAFISYSHADENWGSWLHRSLETYRTPKPLIGKATNRGEPVPERVFPIFRDREELPTSADLGSTISDALEQARYLIVICSKASAKSRWVNEEIKAFKKMGRSNRILALIVDGEPNAAEGKPGVGVDEECFPQALKHPLGNDGELDLGTIAEPIAADVRPGKDGKQDGLLKLLAGLLGVNFDDLKRRDEIRRRKRQQAIVTTAGSLAVIFAILAGFAVWQWQESERRGREVRRGMAASDLEHALGLDPNRAAEAARLEARALRLDPDTPYGPLALYNRLASRRWLQASRLPVNTSEPITELVGLQGEGSLATLTTKGVVAFHTRGASKVVGSLAAASAIAANGQTLYVGDASGSVNAHETPSTERLWTSRPVENRISMLEVPPSGTPLLVGPEASSVILMDPANGQVIRTIALPEQPTRILPHPTKPIAAILMRNAGCFLIRTDIEAEATPVWPPKDSPLVGQFGETVLDAMFGPADRLMLAGGDRFLHGFAFSLPESGAATVEPVGEFQPEIPPVRLAGSNDMLIVGARDGTLSSVNWETLSATIVEGPPARAESLIGLAETGDDMFVRLFASGRCDAVSPDSFLPPVEAYQATYSPKDLANVGDELVLLGQTSRPVSLQLPPTSLQGATVQQVDPIGTPPSPLIGVPDSTEVYQATTQGVSRRDLQNGESSLIVPLDARPAALALSPDGTKLGVVTDKELIVANKDGSVAWRGNNPIETPELRGEWNVLWADTGSWFAAWVPSTDKTLLAVVDLSAGQLIPKTFDNGLGQLLASPDGKRIITANASGELAEWKAPSLELIEQRALPTSPHRPVAQPRRSVADWEHDCVYIGTFGGDVISFHLGTGEHERATENGPVAHLQLSPDGKQLLVVNDLGVVRILETGNALTLSGEFRLSNPQQAPGLLWAGTGPEGTLATIDRFQGVQLWDWRGRNLATRGPQNSPTERDPANLNMIVVAGGNETQVWLAFMRNQRVVTRLVNLAPSESAEKLVEQAEQLTGSRLGIDGNLEASR